MQLNEIEEKLPELPTILQLEDGETENFKKELSNKSLCCVLIGDKKFIYFDSYKLLGHKYYRYRTRPDDVIVASFMRSGTTWTQELVWLLGNDLNYSVALSQPLHDRFPFLEIDMGIDGKSPKASQLQRLEGMASPRYIKTHFPFCLIPGIIASNSKIIYVARNPKDVAVSLYHFTKNFKIEPFEGDFERFWNYFQNDSNRRLPYWEHLKEAWAQRHNPNMLFIFYEELSYNLEPTMKKVAAFLGKSYTNEEYEKLADHLNVKNMKANRMIYASAENSKLFFDSRQFVRKGKAGAWHDIFTSELKAQANKWIEENLSDTDLRFPYIDVYS